MNYAVCELMEYELGVIEHPRGLYELEFFSSRTGNAVDFQVYCFDDERRIERTEQVPGAAILEGKRQAADALKAAGLRAASALVWSLYQPPEDFDHWWNTQQIALRIDAGRLPEVEERAG